MVAAARAIATNVDDPVIDDPFAEPLVRAVGVDFFTRWATGQLEVADAGNGSWGLRQMADMMAARTRFFDDFFDDATRAGLDPRCAVDPLGPVAFKGKAASVEVHAVVIG